MRGKYLSILAGYEKLLSITDADIKDCKADLEIALHDQNACLSCQGTCSTFHGIQIDGKPAYFGLYPKAMKFYKRLHFAFFPCPGAEVRGYQLERRLYSDEYTEGYYEHPGFRDPFKGEVRDGRDSQGLP